jgi:DNA-directed RNA polymerase subunit RPC12/RpoP
MCIFCKNEIKKEELKIWYVEQCNNCGSKIFRLKKHTNSIIVKQFPKNDRIRWMLLLLPFLFIGLFLLPVILTKMGKTLENIDLRFFQMIFCIGSIILILFFIYCCIKNILNYKKHGYIYYSLNLVKTKDEKRSKLKFLEIYNYLIISVGTLFIIFLIYVILKYHIN